MNFWLADARPDQPGHSNLDELCYRLREILSRYETLHPAGIEQIDMPIGPLTVSLAVGASA